MVTDARELMSQLEQFLIVVSTVALSYDELDPPGFAQEIVKECAAKRLPWRDGNHYVPNIVRIFVPPMKPKRLQELEAIFNSHNFIEPIYQYVAAQSSKLFDFLRVEIDVLPGTLQKDRAGRSNARCRVRLEWPTRGQSPSGLDVAVEANQARIINVTTPPTEIPHYALLQPINARTYRDHFLIIKKVTNLGRARNIISGKGELIARNEFAFARTADRINKSVSRQHARIEFRGGEFYLYDCGSRRGSAIQRHKQGWREIAVSPEDERGHQLEDHDIIRLGSALISFELIEPSALPTLITQLFLANELAGPNKNPSSQRSFTKFIERFDLQK